LIEYSIKLQYNVLSTINYTVNSQNAGNIHDIDQESISSNIDIAANVVTAILIPAKSGRKYTKYLQIHWPAQKKTHYDFFNKWSWNYICAYFSLL
jgi:hypothetical protein